MLKPVRVFAGVRTSHVWSIFTTSLRVYSEHLWWTVLIVCGEVLAALSSDIAEGSLYSSFYGSLQFTL